MSISSPIIDERHNRSRNTPFIETHQCRCFVSMLKLGSDNHNLPFCDNPFRDNVEKSELFSLIEASFFSWEVGNIKIIAIYFFAFGNIYI